jgi:hypothetical protein
MVPWFLDEQTMLYSLSDNFQFCLFSMNDEFNLHGWPSIQFFEEYKFMTQLFPPVITPRFNAFHPCMHHAQITLRVLSSVVRSALCAH